MTDDNVVADPMTDSDEIGVTDSDEIGVPSGAGPEPTPHEGGVEAARARNWPRTIAFAALPALVLMLGALAGFLKWQSESRYETSTAAVESVAVARETTAAILSYNAGTVDKDLNAGRERLTGSFLEAYTKLVNDVVIPGAKEKKISAVAQVPAAASVSATRNHAVALVFVNQSTTVGNDPPTNTTSSVLVTLDKVNARWLVSGFDPV